MNDINDLTVNDIMLFFTLTFMLALVVVTTLWAMDYKGRKRWSAERADRVVTEGIRLLKTSAGDVVVVTYPGRLTKEQGMQIKEAMERALPKGVKAMLMDGGMRMSHVAKVSDAPIEQLIKARNG